MTGWGVACKRLGIEEYGVELMEEAVQTRTANGMKTILRDVWDGLMDGAEILLPEYNLLIASPPCQTFSMAGRGSGRRALDEVLEAIELEAYKRPEDLKEFGRRHDDRTALVLSPLAYVWRDRPKYVAFEQVPTVLPVWEACAEVMRGLGYSVKTEVLHAEQYGILWTCPLHTAQSVAPSLDPATVPANVRASAMTRYDSEWTPLAWAAVADWVRGTARDAASLVTWLKQERLEATKAAEERTMLGGLVDGVWTTEVISEFGLTVDTVESIVWSWNRWLEDHSLLKKWFTTSTNRQITTIQAILSSIAVTLTTDYITAPGAHAEDCGLCLDTAVPQTRKRAILVARLDADVQLPKPTHSRYHSSNPKKLDPGVRKWVSMAEALGWARSRETGWIFCPTNLRPHSGFRESDQPASALAFGHDNPRWITEEELAEYREKGTPQPGVKLDVEEISVLQSYPSTGRGLTDRPSPTITGGGTETGGAEPIAKYHERYTSAANWAGSTDRLSPEEAAALQTHPEALRSNYGTAGNPKVRGRRRIDQPAPTLTSKADRNKWDGREMMNEQQASKLQTFEPPFIWCGSKTKVFLQIGNAVPPLLAQQILVALLEDPVAKTPKHVYC